MEWRQQTSVSCADAFTEAQRWIEEVTGKSFGCNDFRAALENGVLLCDLINQLKPGIIKRVNRLSTPIAGLDNVNVFLKACGKLGLNVSQLFHPGDLQDLSTRATLRRDESKRRLKNVLITIYWLGRKAHIDAFYSGPQLNFKAFEGLLGLALSKALDEGSNVYTKDGGYRECWDSEREECLRMRPSYKIESSMDRVDTLDSRAIHPNSEGCGSDAEAEQVFKMETAQTTTQQSKGHIPQPLLRRKQGLEQNFASPLSSIEDTPFSPQPHLTVSPSECAFDEELFLQALCEEESEDDYPEADPVLDDLYLRRVQQSLHQTSTNPSHDRFLPRYWTPEEEVRVRTIYLGSQRRPWYRKMQGLRAYQIQVRPERQVQVNPGWIWSKSLSDIPMVYPVRKVPEGNIIYDVGQEADMALEWNQENKRKCSVAAKDSEAQWQDDLTKWKNRRRSTKSDLRRKSQDRDHVINQMTNGSLANFGKNEAGGPLKRDQQSPRRHNPAPRPYSTSPPSKASSSDLRPHTRALLARSYATEAPYSPTAPLSPHKPGHTQGSSVGAMPASDGNLLGEEAHFASLALNGTGVTTPSPDFPFSSHTQVKAQGMPAPFQSTSELARPENVFTNQISTLTTTIQPNETTKSTSTRDPTATMSSCKELPYCADPKGPTSCPGAVHQAGLDALDDHKPHEENQKTSWEPAVEQGRDQQTSGVYKYLYRAGSWSGSASLPRGYRRSEGSSRLSSAITARPFGSKQSRVSSLPRLCNVDNNQGLLLKSEKEESLSQPIESSLKRQTASTHLTGQHQPLITHRKGFQAKQHGAEQREEVKGVTLSSQTNGYHHQPYSQTQLQPYSNPQAHHNNSSTFSTNASIDHTKVDHSDMRVSLTLKPNSRPDFGFQTHWDSTGARVKSIQPGSPAELCQLCVDDEIVAVNGVAVAHMNYTQWKDKMTSSLQTGGLTMDIRRYGNKDWSTSEGTHHNQPGQSRMTLNLTSAAPVLIGCPDHHANGGASTETAVRKVSSFNGQTDNLQVPSLSPSSSSWSWDREEDRRRQEKWQEEQERLLQEKYQRDQERLEAEWRKAQQDAMGECRKTENTFEMTNGGERPASTPLHVNGLANKTREEKQNPDRYELKESEPGSKPQSKAQGVQNDKTAERAWAEDSCGFAQLSPAHRAKSLSTPALAGHHKQIRGDERKRKGQSLSKIEKERQQILEEMKKRTQLLTDNSWIRQRSSSFYKEPIYVGAPLKRFDSLDNLDTSLTTAPFNYPRPHSAAAGYCAPSRNASSRYSTGAIVSQRNASMDPSNHGRMVSGRRMCCVCERALGSGAAMVIEALSLCLHLACFQCVGCHRHLGGTETGVQVRIRNRKPYCEPCYFQLKSFGAPSM
ncbi:LIM domain only protein 7 [Collichthys lucidus]|uniref:LIM domain only protein 7 n=1 Tax=Collichthys lucidus TaxID=240159 RepID=A0A4U5U7W5_COLLU|nr:LIM domain only protein 7 [Collichthys lucidus]